MLKRKLVESRISVESKEENNRKRYNDFYDTLSEVYKSKIKSLKDKRKRAKETHKEEIEELLGKKGILRLIKLRTEVLETASPQGGLEANEKEAERVLRQVDEYSQKIEMLKDRVRTRKEAQKAKEKEFKEILASLESQLMLIDEPA